MFKVTKICAAASFACAVLACPGKDHDHDHGEDGNVHHQRAEDGHHHHGQETTKTETTTPFIDDAELDDLDAEDPPKVDRAAAVTPEQREQLDALFADLSKMLPSNGEVDLLKWEDIMNQEDDMDAEQLIKLANEALVEFKNNPSLAGGEMDGEDKMPEMGGMEGVPDMDGVEPEDLQKMLEDMNLGGMDLGEETAGREQDQAEDIGDL